MILELLSWALDAMQLILGLGIKFRDGALTWHAQWSRLDPQDPPSPQK